MRRRDRRGFSFAQIVMLAGTFAMVVAMSQSDLAVVTARQARHAAAHVRANALGASACEVAGQTGSLRDRFGALELTLDAGTPGGKAATARVRTSVAGRTVEDVTGARLAPAR